MSLSALLHTLLLSVLITTCYGETIINVDSNTPPGQQSNLLYHLCTVSDQIEPDTVMILAPGVYEIEDGPSCIISNTNNLTIRGAEANGTDGVSELNCVFNFFGRNFIFINVTDLHIENLAIVNCGRSIPEDLPSYVNDSYVFFGEKQKTVLFFVQVTNLYVESVILANSFGYGIIGFNLQGNNLLNRVQVVGTDYTRHPLCFGYETDLSCTGSGAIFLYSDPTTNNTFPMTNTSLIINNSVFAYNTHIIPLNHYLVVYTLARSPYQTERVVMIGATGVTIYIGQRTFFADIQVRDTLFNNNDGQSSSLVIVQYNTIRDSLTLVDNCTFRDNEVRAPGRGGALSMLLLIFIDALQMFPVYPDDVFTILSITNSEFIDNRGFIGGALYLHMSPVNITDYRINIDSVSFIRNVAPTGSAIEANSIPTLFIQRSNEITLQDITVLNNTFPTTILTTTSTIDNSAAIVLTLVNNVTISGRNDTQGSLFAHNSPGAVLVSGGKLFLRGHIEFTDNIAFRGGGLALFDYTLLHIQEGSRIKFKRNHALQTGGAIFANSLSTGVTDVCVFQVIGSHRISSAEDVGLLDLKIKFEANSAGVAGNSIYASPLYNCAYLPEASTVQNNFNYRVQDIYQEIFNFEHSVLNGNQEITSVPDRIAFCDPSDYTSNPVLLRTNITTIPGKQFSHLFVPIDAILTRVQSVMYAELETELLKLGPAQSTRRLSGHNCSLVNFNIYGPENSQGNMVLYARLGGVGLTVEVTLGECPPGFHLDTVNDLEQCVCDAYVLDVLATTCNTSTYTILRPGRSWIGVVDHSEYNTSDVVWVSTCPADHCNQISDVDLTIEDQICQTGRSGVLCGRCREGVSVVFGSANCEVCSNYWLFSIIVYAVAGILLVIFLFWLNITVAQGTINGAIFYVNIVSVNGGIIFGDASFVKIFVSLLNLELGFPVCFYDGMDEAVKIGLQFVFPAYLLVICGVIILASKWSSRIQKLTSCNSIAVLATLVYLSYGKILRTVIDILSFATVNSEFKAHTIWLYDGNLNFFDGVHIVLGLLAIIAALTFLIPYTLPLLFIKHIERHSIRLKPVFDAYAGPYKDKYRYWFGLRLVLLTAMCGTYAIAGTDFQSLALSLETFFLVWFTVWQAYAKPYKNRAVGILDLFYLVNFLTLAIWLLHLVEDVTPLAIPKRVGMVTFLICLAFVVYLGILVYHTYSAFYCHFPKFQEKMDTFWKSVRSFVTYQTFKQMKHKIHRKRNSAADTSPNAELQTYEAPGPSKSVVSFENSTGVTLERKETFSTLREPVLDYAD